MINQWEPSTYAVCCTHPTWNSTFGPMQKKQSIIRNANTIGMLLMNLSNAFSNYPFVSRNSMF